MNKATWKKAYFSVNNVTNFSDLEYEDSYKALVTELLVKFGEEVVKEIIETAEDNYVKFIE